MAPNQSSISFSAAQIADQLQGEVLGDSSVRLTGLAPADCARVGDLTFAEKEAYFAAAEQSLATAVLVTSARALSKKVLIRVSTRAPSSARTDTVMCWMKAVTARCCRSAM